MSTENIVEKSLTDKTLDDGARFNTATHASTLIQTLVSERKALETLNHKLSGPLPYIHQTIKISLGDFLGSTVEFTINHINEHESFGSAKSGYYMSTDKSMNTFGISSLYLGESSEEVDSLLKILQTLSTLALAKNQNNADEAISNVQKLYQ